MASINRFENSYRDETSRDEPWTPYRLIQAFIKAGCPKEALVSIQQITKEGAIFFVIVDEPLSLETNQPPTNMQETPGAGSWSWI